MASNGGTFELPRSPSGLKSSRRLSRPSSGPLGNTIPPHNIDANSAASAQQAMLRYLEDVSRSLCSHLDIVRGCIKLHPNTSTYIAEMAEFEVGKLDVAINNFRVAMTLGGRLGVSPSQGHMPLPYKDPPAVPDASMPDGSESGVTSLVDPSQTLNYQGPRLHQSRVDSRQQDPSLRQVMAADNDTVVDLDPDSPASTSPLEPRVTPSAGKEADALSVNSPRRENSETIVASSIGKRDAPTLNSRAGSFDDRFGESLAPSAIVHARTNHLGLRSRSAGLPRVGDSVRSSCVQSLRLELNRSDQTEARCPSGVLNPRWTGKMIWDLAIILLVLLDALILPFQFAYKESKPQDGFDTMWLWITTASFSIDIWVNFLTAYEAGSNEADFEPGTLVTSKPRIAWHYLRSWFTIDLVSTIPWGVVATALSGGEEGDSGGASLAKLTKAVKFVRFLRLMRMLRLAKLGAIWERIEARMGSMALLQTVALARVMFGLMAICHWNACIWWMLGQEESILTEMFPMEAQRDWRRIPHWTTVEHEGMGEPLPWSWSQQDMAHAYIFCFYWTLGVMRTMPSEVTPVNKAERMYVMVFMFFAFSAFAISVAMITQTFFKISERKRTFGEEMAAIRMYLRRTKSSEVHQSKVKAYLRHIFDKREILAKEENLLRRLPEEMLERLRREKFVSKLKRLRIFAPLEKIMVYHIAAKVQVKDALPGEAIVWKGTLAEAAWILTLGHLRSAGAFENSSPEILDEECLETLDPVQSQQTVTSVACSELMKVSKEEFHQLVLDDANLRESLLQASACSILYQQANEYLASEPKAGGMMIHPQPSHSFEMETTTAVAPLTNAAPVFRQSQRVAHIAAVAVTTGC